MTRAPLDGRYQCSCAADEQDDKEQCVRGLWSHVTCCSRPVPRCVYASIYICTVKVVELSIDEMKELHLVV